MQLNFPTILFTLINILLIVAIIFFVFITIKKAVISLSSTSKSIENMEKKLDKIIILLENNKKQ